MSKSLSNKNGDLGTVHELKRSALNGRTFKQYFRLRTKKAKTSGHLCGRKDKLLVGDDCGTKAIDKDEAGEVIAKKSMSSCNEQSPCRQVSQWKQQIHSFDQTVNREIGGATIVTHDKDISPGPTLNSTCDKGHCAQLTVSQQHVEVEEQQKKCVVCGHTGKLMFCAGKWCSRSFHLSCVNPPFTYDPLGVWHCIWCVKRKIEMDVYTLSEGIESVLDAMEVSDKEAMQKQKKYLVKYKGLAHIHNRWIPEKTLILEAPSLFARYKKKSHKVIWKREWCLPQRLLAKRLLVFPEPCNGSSGKIDDCHYEWLVKWTGLGYDHATWELENASFLRSPEAMKLMHDFEIRHEKPKEDSGYFEEDKTRRKSHKLSELPFGGSDHLFHVNKLREYWNRDQSALVIDNQERVVRTVLFILSLLKERRGPVLIITTSTALSMWEDELLLRVSLANFVVYKGSRDTRSMIRHFEFCNKDGGIMFQVLLSPCIALVEDIEYFKPIKWEVMIIDECQRSTISAHFRQIKLLATHMRLLLVSSQIKDWSSNYHITLSLLDPEYNGVSEDNLEANPNVDTSKLKEKLVHFIAYENKCETVRFVEFWVPVMLTNVQIEQYCASLFSRSMMLCSCLKSDSTGSLHDILISSRKCCDHPFLVNWSLRSLVLEGIPPADHFDVEIQLSGKLLLLDKILPVIERQGLRVAIFFQSIGGSAMISIGDILDDFIHKKFGGDSYVRIDGNISRSRKQAACDMFNIKDNRKFICLIEARACLASTKLSSVDTIIIFNGDWNPLNDLRALQKINFGSQFEQMKIFRLYSPCTVEEKVLILAREGMTLDSNMKKSICHKLLAWGASLLFSKIDGSHEFNLSCSGSINFSEQTLLEDVVRELSLLLPSSNGENDSTDCSILKDDSINVLIVKQNGGSYNGRYSLIGELIAQSMDNFSIIRHLMDAEAPHSFWTNLLEGRQPRWKYISSQLQRIKRKAQQLDSLPKETEYEGEVTKKGKRETNGIVKRIPNLQLMMRRISQSSATKKYKSVQNLVKDIPAGCARKVLNLRNHDRDAHQHSEAASLFMLGTSNNSNLSGGEPGNSLAERSLPPYQPYKFLRPKSNAISESTVAKLPNSTAAGDNPDNGHSSFTSASSCQAQLETPRQGSICQYRTSPQQFVQKLPLQPSMNSIYGSEQDAANLGDTDNVRDYSRSQHTETTSRTPPSAPSATLEEQMERIWESKKKAMKLHEDLKLSLESESEKELDEICKKYELLLHNAETASAQMQAHLETCYNIVHEQKLLAEAMLQKQHVVYAASSQGEQEVILSSFINDIYRLCFAQSRGTNIPGPCPPGNPPSQEMSNSSSMELAAARDPATPEQNLMGTLEIVSPPLQTFALEERSLSSARTTAGNGQSSAGPEISSCSKISSGPTHASVPFIGHLRPISISPIHSAGNLHSGLRLRAPAPHLRHSRPYPAISTPDLQYLPSMHRGI